MASPNSRVRLTIGEFLAARQQFAQHGRKARLRSVQHEDELVVLVERVEPGFIFGVQLGRIGLPGTDGNDDGDRDG